MDQEKRKQYKLFDGSRSGNSCAYCWKHHKGMTPKQLQSRQCLKRQCDALQRCDHPYWQQREKTKEARRARKDRLEKQYREVMSNAVCSETASGDRC